MGNEFLYAFLKSRRQFADDPQTKGLEHYGDRLLEIDEFGIIFDYVEDDRLVRILDFFQRP